MKNRLALPLCCYSALVLILSCHSAVAVDYHLERLTNDLHIPLGAVTAPGITDKLFIPQLGGTSGDNSDGSAITSGFGRVVIYDRNTGQVDYNNPFLEISDTSLNDPFFVPEVGLFSLAFHPDFQSNGKFYVNVAIDHTGPPPTVDFRTSPFKTVVREYTVNPADPNLAITSQRTILELDQPAVNHNGSWLGFSPAETALGDNYLYITQGDGGDQHDPADYGQDPNSWFGTVMRIDVDGDDFPGDPDRNYAVPASNPFVGGGGAPEVWSYGLRNPWRASFDSVTSDLWIGDVGQVSFEEVHFQAASNTGGDNYGWRLREGFVATPSGGVGGPAPVDNVDPVYAYAHGGGQFEGASVTGGYVYRGASTDLYGKYIFADNSSGHIWAFDPSDPNGTVEVLDDVLNPYGQIIAISSFGEDENGNVLIVDGAGGLYQIADGTRSDLNNSGTISPADWLIFRR